MTDILVRWDDREGGGDLVVDSPDLAADRSLRTAVVLSLFTDRRAGPDDVPAPYAEPRGWWGDQLSADDDEIGSLLWQLEREKETTETLARATEYTAEALRWMRTDAVLDNVEVSAAFPVRGTLGLSVSLTHLSGDIEDYQFSIEGLLQNAV